MHQIDDIVQELEQCSFHRWYPYFSKIAMRGVIVPIPDVVVDYLRDEIVILPKECYPPDINGSRYFTDIEIFTGTITPTLAPIEPDPEADLLQPHFPVFSQTLTDVISQLRGGGAFLKTRWHAPKDSFWITAGQTSKVQDITDVYQLLKASSIVKQDLFDKGLPEIILHSLESSTDAQQTPNEGNYLVFKDWHEIHPGTEFRCFVRRRNLIAISPRDWPAYHEFILEQNREICSDITTIFKEKIKTQFPLENYTFDVIRRRKDHVMLVDFSPFNSFITDSLAFEWAELGDDCVFLEEDEPEFRYLPTDCGIQPSKRNNYGVPVDIIRMFGSADTGHNSNLDIATLMIDQMQ